MLIGFVKSVTSFRFVLLFVKPCCRLLPVCLVGVRRWLREGRFKVLVLLFLCLTVTGCATRPPKAIDNICDIFKEKRAWHAGAQAMQKRWSVPVQVPMAMMYQESRFVSDAKPARNYTFFGLIPWGRKSSAYGYSQALDGTWDSYKTETKNYGADRDDFADAIDFMGWYIHKTHKQNGVSKDDAYRQYLNYHEGWSGYRQKKWLKKKWLIRISSKVKKRSKRYHQQYQGCKQTLSQGFWYRLFH
jgi:hypothetical protein